MMLMPIKIINWMNLNMNSIKWESNKNLLDIDCIGSYFVHNNISLYQWSSFVVKMNGNDKIKMHKNKIQKHFVFICYSLKDNCEYCFVDLEIMKKWDKRRMIKTQSLCKLFETKKKKNNMT